MKRIVLLLLVLTLALGSIFAISNGQKIYSVDSPAYASMEKLYILSGKALPSSSGPWSENELLLMLGRINREQLSKTEKAYYDYVKNLITSAPKNQYDDGLSMDFGFQVNLESYTHSNPEKFVDEEYWYHGFNTRSHFLKGTFETWPEDKFYSYFELSLGNNIGYCNGSINEAEKSHDADNNYYKGTFNLNIPIVGELLTGNLPVDSQGDTHLLADFDWTVPYRAFVAVGGDHWSAEAGRDKLSWGNGETGNMMFSSSFPRHTLLRFSTFFDAFKYSVVGTIYPTMKTADNGDGPYDSLDGYKAIISHRMEFNLLDGKAGLSINEAAAFWSTTYTDDDGNEVKEDFNLLQVNPFGFMHNEYIAANANSLLVFEANYTPIKGINVYGQFAMDEFAGPGEGRTNPSAFGKMIGVKGATTVGEGILKGSLEYVETDPFLFIRGLHYNKNSVKGYGFDALFKSVSSDSMLYKKMFTTYTYGNDAVIMDLKGSYELPGTAVFGIEGMVKLKGAMSIDSSWGQFRKGWLNLPDPKTPTSYSPFDDVERDADGNPVLDANGNPVLKPEAANKAVEKSYMISLSADYQTPVEGLKVYGYMDLLWIKNLNNQKGNDTSDAQLTLGVSYSL
ncbi:MAG: hypothetical protein KBS81_09675 [Spirochaetales bacterium]|nr:hypothetical protein [Candidatus Physcosoma equi]